MMNVARKADDGGLTATDWLVSGAWALSHAVGEGNAYLTGETAEFPFTETDEFMIRERLGRHGVDDPEIHSWLGLLD